MSGAKNVSSSKAGRVKAHLEQENSKDHEKAPASDLYSKVKNKDPETGVGRPTEETMEEAIEWNQESQMQGKRLPRESFLGLLPSSG